MNILVYVVDCLRSDHLSCYGYERETTPNIDELAADGIRYERCFTPSTWTRPVSASLLTGMYPPAHGVRHREDTFPSSLPRLSQSLSESGFKTVGISTMGNVSSALGYDTGFDQYLNLYKKDDIVERRTNSSTDRERLIHEDRDRIALPRAEDINEYLGPILKQTDGDLFSFCWSIDPHMPLAPPEEYRNLLDPTYEGPIDGSHDSVPENPTDDDIARLRDLYDAEICYTDEQFGHLVETLKKQGEYEDSLIVLLGDHGEAHGEHEFLFHGNRPYEELARVPLVVKPPADSDVSSGPVSDLVSLIDVFPTVLDVVGEKPPVSVQGRVVPPFGSSDDTRSVFSETQVQSVESTHRSVRTQRWKCIETEHPPLVRVLRQLFENQDTIPNLRYALAVVRDALYAETFGGSDTLLFNLESDPGEHNDLAAESPEKLECLQRLLDEWLEECQTLNERVSTTDDRRIDAATAEQLRQLGYTD